MNDQIQSDLDENIGNAYSLVEETYRFCTYFFEDVKAAVVDIGEEKGIEPLKDSFITTRPRSLKPEFLFTRAFGTFFGEADLEYRHGQLSQDLQIPFLFFRFVGEEGDPAVLIYGHYTNFQEEERSWKKRRTSWFQRPIRYKDNVFLESPTIVEGRSLRYQINFQKDPLSRWIEENREEQQGKAVELANKLIKQFRSAEARRPS